MLLCTFLSLPPSPLDANIVLNLAITKALEKASLTELLVLTGIVGLGLFYWPGIVGVDCLVILMVSFSLWVQRQVANHLAPMMQELHTPRIPYQKDV